MRQRLQRLNMGDFTDEEVAICETLLATIDLQKMLHHSGFNYPKNPHLNFENLLGLLEQPLARHLKFLIAELLKQLAKTDPEKLFKEPSWLQMAIEKTSGKAHSCLEAKQHIDSLIKEADVVAGKLELMLAEIAVQLKLLRNEMANLRLLIAAGRLYLADLPDTLSIPVDDYAAVNPVQRFSRSIATMAALLTSHKMTAVQLEMAYAQTEGLLARYYDCSRVLIPVWQENSLVALLSGQYTPVKIRLMKQTYNTLKHKLSQFI